MPSEASKNLVCIDKFHNDGLSISFSPIHNDKEAYGEWLKQNEHENFQDVEFFPVLKIIYQKLENDVIKSRNNQLNSTGLLLCFLHNFISRRSCVMSMMSILINFKIIFIKKFYLNKMMSR